jgi:hypothetical protein
LKAKISARHNTPFPALRQQSPSRPCCQSRYSHIEDARLASAARFYFVQIVVALCGKIFHIIPPDTESVNREYTLINANKYSRPLVFVPG